MKLQRRHRITLLAALTLISAFNSSAFSQEDNEYTITVLPPGEPTPRLPNGHPDFTGMWLPNSAGQGVSGRFGVDPAARRQFDPDVTPEEPPSFQAWAAARMAAMTPTELELSKSSVNCMPRGVPAIWLQNPYGTMLVHSPGVLAQLFEVLNNFRVIYTDGRPAPEYPEPLFHGNSTTHWKKTRWSLNQRHSTQEPSFCRMAGSTVTNSKSPKDTRARPRTTSLSKSASMIRKF